MDNHAKLDFWTLYLNFRRICYPHDFKYEFAVINKIGPNLANIQPEKQWQQLLKELKGGLFWFCPFVGWENRKKTLSVECANQTS